MRHKRKELGKAWRLPDSLWEKIQPLIPRSRRRKIREPNPLPWRGVIDGTLYILRTGCDWCVIPEEFGDGDSIRLAFRLLAYKRIFPKIWAIVTEHQQDFVGINWKRRMRKDPEPLPIQTTGKPILTNRLADLVAGLLIDVATQELKAEAAKQTTRKRRKKG